MRPTRPLLNKFGSAASIKANCRKVMCIGRNYAEHIKELNNQRPNAPFFFLKPPSSILTPDEGPMRVPRGVINHHEVELGLVIGTALRDSDPDDVSTALNSIGAYILAVDMTARNVQDAAKKKGLPWSIAKGFDTYCPISEPIEKSRIPDPQDVDLWLSVNQEMKQSDNTNLMLFRIPRMLSDISRVMALEPGDIILTGTPKGVGPVKKGDFLEAGLSVGGQEVKEAHIKVDVVERDGPYEFKDV